MKDLRSEIRAAFEKEQSAYPPAAALRRNVVEAVTTPSRRAPNREWLAVAVAALLVIAAVLGLMSTRFANRSSVPARPQPTPTVGPLVDHGPPPAGVPLVYVVDPRNYSWLQAYDWQGTLRGTVKLSQPVDKQYEAIGMAPDGSGFVNKPQGKGGGVEYLDRLGQPIPPGALSDAGGNLSEMWADDSRHRCFVRFDTPSGEWRLITKLPGQADHFVGVIATDPNIGQTGISLASCSFRNDQAILVRTTIASPSEVWVVRLYDGKMVAHGYPTNAPSAVVASGDSKYIAENSGPGALETRIRRVSDWLVVTTLPAGESVLGFSGDDSLVLVTTAQWSQGQPTHLALIDLGSGQAVWRYDGPEQLGSFLAQPDGTDFAISMVTISLQPSPCGNTPQTACHYAPPDSVRDVLIVHADGSTTAIPGRYIALW